MADVQGSSTNPWETETQLTNAAPAAEAETGTGGTTLVALSAARQSQLRDLVQGPVTDNTTYGLPSGVVDPTPRSFETQMEDGELQPAAPDTEAETGPGGDDLAAFQDARQIQLRNLAAATHTDESSFGLPGGVVDATARPFETQMEAGERKLGVNVSGLLRDGEGLPLSGTARLEREGEVKAAVEVTGSYTITLGVPEAVLEGSCSQLGTYNFRFIPDITGFDLFQTGINLVDTIDALYGTISGSVTDYQGNAVIRDEVVGEVSGQVRTAITDSQGQFEFVGPDSKTATITALYGSHQVKPTFTKYQTKTQDFQYQSLVVMVSLPGGIDVSDALVEVIETADASRTNSAGRVQFDQVPVNSTITLQILQAQTFDQSTGAQGGQVTKDVLGGVALLGTVEEAESGDPIRDVDVHLVGDELTARVESNLEGDYTIGTFESGSLTLQIAKDDPRYLKQEIAVEMDDGDADTQNVELERAYQWGVTN